MRRRYRQDPKTGKLTEIPAGRPVYAGTYTVGDAIDAMHDRERHKREQQAQAARERKQTIIEAVYGKG